MADGGTGGAKRARRLAFIVERLEPYLRARFEALGARIGFENVQVVEVAPGRYARTTSAIDHGQLKVTPVVSAWDYDEIGRFELWRKTVAALDTVTPEVVAIGGWGTTQAWAARHWCNRNRIPSVVIADSQEEDAPRTFLREAARRWYLRGVGAAMVAGAPQRRYVAKLGVPVRKVVQGVDVVDNAHFAQGASVARLNAGDIRQRLDLPECFFLACARLVERNGIATLLRSFARYRESKGPASWGLVVVGDGPLRTRLEAEAQTLGVATNVKWMGVRQYEELPTYYGLASTFVMPSYFGQWGLVVNEAMAAGLPIIVSTACGSSADLVWHGQNGLCVPPRDEWALAAAMGTMSDGGERTKSMGRHSSMLIKQWGLNRFVDGILQAVSIADGCGGAARRLVPHRIDTVLVTNMIPPYRVPVLEKLDALTGHGLHVVTLTVTERNREWKPTELRGPSVEVLRGLQYGLPGSERIFHFNFRVENAVQRSHPQAVIVGGWDSLASWRAIRSAKRIGARIILWSGSHRHSSRSRGRAMLALKRTFVRQCDMFVAYGTLARDYLIDLGAPPEHVITATNAVDCEHFAPNLQLRSQVRLRWGAGRSVVVLFSGQLIERKGLDDLIDAVSQLPSHVVLWVAGSGPMRDRYERQAGKALQGRHLFIGHQDYAAMNGILNAADVLVMPSHEEVWGLVVNEAMSAGLPVISSTRAGATVDLVVEGVTGLGVEPKHVDRLAEAIARLASDGQLRARMGNAARARILGRNTTQYAEDIFRAVLRATQSGGDVK